MKKLYIIRHGDSPFENGKSDFERPLSELGINDAKKIGTYLKENCALPSLIISSAANRAFTTATIISKEIGFNPSEITTNKELHNASMETVLNKILEISPKVETTYIFGHNPGLSQLASYLTNEYFQLDTCNVVVLSAELDNWNNLTQGVFSVDEYITP